MHEDLSPYLPPTKHPPPPFPYPFHRNQQPITQYLNNHTTPHHTTPHHTTAPAILARTVAAWHGVAKPLRVSGEDQRESVEAAAEELETALERFNRGGKGPCGSRGAALALKRAEEELAAIAARMRGAGGIAGGTAAAAAAAAAAVAKAEDAELQRFMGPKLSFRIRINPIGNQEEAVVGYWRFEENEAKAAEKEKKKKKKKKGNVEAHRAEDISPFNNHAVVLGAAGERPGFEYEEEDDVRSNVFLIAMIQPRFAFLLPSFAFMHSFIRLFIPSFVRSFVCSFAPSTTVHTGPRRHRAPPRRPTRQARQRTARPLPPPLWWRRCRR